MLLLGPLPGGIAEQRRPPLPFGSGARALLLRIQEPKLRLVVSEEAVYALAISYYVVLKS